MKAGSSAGHDDAKTSSGSKTMFHLWTSVVIACVASIALFSSSTWAVYADEDCESHLCIGGGWGLVFCGLMMFNCILGIFNNCKAKNMLIVDGDTDKKESEPFLNRDTTARRKNKRVSSLVMTENTISLVLTLYYMYGSMMTAIFFTRTSDKEKIFRFLFFVSSLVSAAFSEFYCLWAKLNYIRTSSKDKNKLILLSSNVLLLAMGLTLVSLNTALTRQEDRWVFHGMTAVGILCIVSSSFGVLITAVVHSKLSDAFLSSTALPLPYLLIEMFTLGTSIAFTFGNIMDAVVYEIHADDDMMQTGLELNSAVGFIVCVVTFAIHSAYNAMLNPRLPSPYVATMVNLQDINKTKMRRWGDAINKCFGTKYIGAWDGHAALSLMKTYQGILRGGKTSPVPHTNCAALLIHSKNANEEDGECEPVAIVFVCIMEKFNLTNYLPGTFGAILNFCFGQNSYIPLLCLRWGLVGFQFPFHSGIFLLEKGRNPINQMTLVQRAVVDWNDGSPLRCSVLMSPSYVTQLDTNSFQMSHFLNLPVGPSVLVDLRRYKGMEYKDFQRVALKKGNRRNHHDYFKKKGGSTSVSENFEEFDEKYPEVCSALCNSTAKQRRSRGELPPLHPVTPSLYHAVATQHETKYRQVFGIRVNETPAGTAVLFKFPSANLLTSDMQGLRHELARPTRAYFAMLAMTVEKALKEGYDFLDFGPTTLEPKMDVGGRLIECRAGYHTRSMFMRALLKQGNDNFRAQQEAVEARMQKGEKDTKAPWRAHKLPYIKSDFQYCTEAILTKYKVEDEMVMCTDHKHPGKQVAEKKSKKQLNKEKRKASRRARKLAERERKEQELESPRIVPSSNPTVDPTIL